MKTDQDIERAITGWLSETAVRRAPDRVLEEAHRTIDDTKQRRVAAWRAPMFSSLPKTLAAGVAIIAIALASGLVGRSTAGVATPGSSSSPALASPSTAAMPTYRLARNAICTAAQVEKDGMSARWDGVFDSDTSDERRADGTAALQEFITLTDEVADELGELIAPPDLAEAHAANVTQYRGLTALIRRVVSLLMEGKVEEASVVDDATDVITVDFEAFERVNQLTPCP